VLFQPRDAGHSMPLGLLALGSWLEGRHVVIVDGRFELAPEARVVELARSALLVGVSARSGEPLGEALRVSRAVRAAVPRLPIVWGGPHAQLDPASCLATGAVDGCVAGAGEEPLQAAVAALRASRPLASAAGLVVAGAEAAAAAPAAPPARLWPRADYSLLDVERYFEARGARRLDYCSSRGGREAGDWMGLRPERVVGEVVELAERYRASGLTFQDEDFFADAERVEAIAAGLVESGARIPWRARARVEDVLEAQPGALPRLAAGGCRGLQLPVGGVERERVLEAAERLRGARIGGRFVFEVPEAKGRGKGLAAAVATARALCAMDSSFRTPILRRAAPLAPSPGRSVEAWAAVEATAQGEGVEERRLRRVAFYFAEAQRPPGRRLGKHLLRVLSLLRVRLGFFALDVERGAVELSVLVRTGRPRRPPREE
jgi:hypothetical protein